jgi:hypothetical protein
MLKPPYPWCDGIDHDSFGRLDLSGSGGYSGAIGCMLARLAEIDTELEKVQQRIAFLDQSRKLAQDALDVFCDQQYAFLHPDAQKPQA